MLILIIGDFSAKQHLSTTPSAEVYEILKKKKRRIKSKKFTELLQGTFFIIFISKKIFQ